MLFEDNISHPFKDNSRHNITGIMAAPGDTPNRLFLREKFGIDNNSFREVSNILNAWLGNRPIGTTNELEVRFGTFIGEQFKSNIQPKVFYGILDWLTKFPNVYSKVTTMEDGIRTIQAPFPIKTVSSNYPGNIRSEVYYDTNNNLIKTVISEKVRMGNPIDNRSYNFRVALSSEKILKNAPTEAPTLIRSKTRWSFTSTEQWLTQFRIDLTKVGASAPLRRSSTGADDATATTKEVTTYEIELEFIGRPASVEHALLGIFFFMSVMQRAPSISEVTSKTEVYGVIKNYNAFFEADIKEFEAKVANTRKRIPNWNWETYNIFNKPVNIPRDIVRDNEPRLTVTDKAHGERIFALVCPALNQARGMGLPLTVTLYLVSPITSNITKIGQFRNVDKTARCTLIDCELVEKTGSVGGSIILGFDILFENGVDKRNQTHGARIELLKSYIARLKVPITPKGFFSGGESLHQRSKQALEMIQSNTLPYKNDGLIFNYMDMPYDSIVYKWKPAEEMTIDFLLKEMDSRRGGAEAPEASTDNRRGGAEAPRAPGASTNNRRGGAEAPSTYGLYVVRENGGLEQFNDETITVNSSDAIKIEENQIAECLYDFETKKFKIVRMRLDRQNPNSILVAKSVWNDILHPITKDMMMGLIPVPDIDIPQQPLSAEDTERSQMKKYHNLMKREMIGATSGKLILDIGGGRGGDIGKWKQFSKSVLSIEPNMENAAEFSRRMNASKSNEYKLVDENTWSDNKSIIKLVPGVGGESTHLIGSHVPKFLSRVGKHGDTTQWADTVEMFNVLTYFFESETKLDHLLETIDASLQKGGKFIGMVMDKDALMEVLSMVREHNHSITGHPDTTTNRYEAVDDATGKLAFFFEILEESGGHYGNKILINITSSIVNNQIEYLVDFDELVRKMGTIGLVLESSKSLTGHLEKGFQLSIPERICSGLYRDFVFVRESIPPPQTCAVEPMTTAVGEREPLLTVYNSSHAPIKFKSVPDLTILDDGMLASVLIKNMTWTREGSGSGSMVEALLKSMKVKQPAKIVNEITAALKMLYSLRRDESEETFGLLGSKPETQGLSPDSIRSVLRTLQKCELKNAEKYMNDYHAWDLIKFNDVLCEFASMNILVLYVTPDVSHSVSMYKRWSPTRAADTTKTVVLLNNENLYDSLFLTDVSGNRKYVFESTDRIILDLGGSRAPTAGYG
jgi:hypothetical protein